MNLRAALSGNARPGLTIDSQEQEISIGEDNNLIKCLRSLLGLPFVTNSCRARYESITLRFHGFDSGDPHRRYFHSPSIRPL